MKLIEYYIAQRYLISKRKMRFINVITFISIIGVTIGVAALLIALSVYNGFTSVVTEVLLGFDPHIRIEKRGGIGEKETLLIQKCLDEIPNISGTSPYISGKVLISGKLHKRVVKIIGVDQQRIGTASGLKEKIVLGELMLSDSTQDNGIVIGFNLADRLGVVVGDQLNVISPNYLTSVFSNIQVLSPAVFQISGIYESNNREYDANYAYVSLNAAKRLFGLSDKYHGIDIRLDDYKHSEKVKSMLEKNLSKELIISTWYDLHKSLYTMMNLERWGAYILLSMIIMVATFNMLGSLIMGVVEKRRDIGILKSLGMSSNGITRIFMLEGLLIGVIGTIFGILLGLFVLYLQIHYHIFPLDTTVFIIPAIPVKIHWLDFITVSAASLGLSFIASFYPARNAAGINISEAIRWE